MTDKAYDKNHVVCPKCKKTKHIGASCAGLECPLRKEPTANPPWKSFTKPEGGAVKPYINEWEE